MEYPITYKDALLMGAHVEKMQPESRTVLMEMVLILYLHIKEAESADSLKS